MLLVGEDEAWSSLAILAHRLAGLEEPGERRARLGRTLALLAQHGSGVTALTVCGGGAAENAGTSLAELLLLLPSPGRLAHLLLEHDPVLPQAGLEALRRFPLLASLEPHAAQVPEGAAAVLGALAQLSSMTLRVGKLSTPLMAALAGLPQLPRLALEVPRLAPPCRPWLAELGGRLASVRVAAALLPGSIGDDLLDLSQLTHLDLESAESPLPPLQQLTALSTLRTLRMHDRGGCNTGAVAFPPAPAAFAGLRRFWFSRGSGWLRRQQTCQMERTCQRGRRVALVHPSLYKAVVKC